MSQGRVDRAALDLVRMALSVDADEFRREAIRCVDRLVGCDTGIAWSLPPSPANATIVGFSEHHWDRYLLGAPQYDAEMAAFHAAAGRAGVAQDTDLVSPRERDRTSFYRDIIDPIGARCFLAAPLMRAGRPIGVFNVGRLGRGARFGARQIDIVKRLVDVLTVGEVVLARRVPAPQALHIQLTPRELEVVNLMSVGLSNREIAAHLGMSANTVRNHLASAYHKAGASNRLELLRFLGDGAPRGKKRR